MTPFTREDVVSRLHEVIDPCSVATNVPLSIVEMGMVEHVEVASCNVVVALRMTSPLCHALPYFEMEVERVLAGIAGIGEVKCTFDHGGNWQPDNMTTEAQRKLAERRELVSSRGFRNAGAALDLRPAAVDKQLDARDETGVVGCQKQCGLGNFLGLSHASHWNGGYNPRNGLGRLQIDDWRFDRSRTHDVGANAAVLQLRGPGSHKGADSGLGRRIDAKVGSAFDAGDGAGENDGSAIIQQR